MNTRTLFFTAVLIAALALGAGLILAQDDGGSDDDSPVSAREHSGFGRRGATGRGFHDFGRGAMGRGMMARGFGMPVVGEALHALVMEATGLEMEALSSAMAEGSSLASLIEANGGDVAAFIAQATELVSARVNEGIAARIEALVNAEHEGRDWRGRQRDKDEKSGGKEHGGREGKAGAESAEEGGEESGTTFTLDEIFDEVRNGVRLVISYEAAANAFSGTIENTTDASIQQVRVEVHLSNGVELGPTPTVSLAPGETREVRLDATGQDFQGWSAHAETGSAEHSGEGEGSDGEHNGEEGEHGSEGSESAQG